MSRLLFVIALTTFLAGCSGSGPGEQEIRLAIEAGRVVNWRAPSLHRLELALFVCDQPTLVKVHRSGCAARKDELAVYAEAILDCGDFKLPMCHEARGIVAAGPPAFSQRIVGYTAYEKGEEFVWYRSPTNPLLESLFSVDDRLALLEKAIRKHAIVLVMLTLLIAGACWLAASFRRRLEQEELNLIERKTELAEIRLSEQRLQAEAARSQELARKFELQAAERKLELERSRDQSQREQHSAERRQHLSSERQRILQMFGKIDY